MKHQIPVRICVFESFVSIPVSCENTVHGDRIGEKGTILGNFGAAWGGLGGVSEAREIPNTSADLCFLLVFESLFSISFSYENTAHGDRI